MRRTILFAIFALVLASCGGDTEESERAEGTSPGASASASATTSSPTASPTSEPNVVLPSDLLGTWTGDVVDPGWDDPAIPDLQRTVWSLTLTLQECDADGRYGYETMATQDYGWTGGPYRCRNDLYYLTTDSGTNTTTFEEHVVPDASRTLCDVARPGLGSLALQAALTPRPDGETLRYHGGMYGGKYGPRGVLQRTSGP